MLCCGVLTGCISSRPTSQGVARIETGCPRVPASRHCDHERRLPPPPTALLLFHGSRSAGVGPGLVDCPPSYPMCCPSVCACGVWCGMCAWTDFARVCRSRPVPTCEGPVCHVPAPAAAQDLQLPREQTVEAVIPFAGGRHGSLHALSPAPHSPRSTPPAPLVGVCSVPCVACACGATTPGVACYRMAVGGARGGEAFGAPHASFMMVPAAPRRIDARGSDRL